jgi:RNA polymerase sigma factor (sigma-70 family)
LGYAEGAVSSLGAPGDLVAFCHVEYPRLVGALSLYCGDRDVAEELAQEALVRACERWQTVREMTSPGAWVYRVALNLAHSHYRRRAVMARVMGRLRGDPQHESDLTDSVCVRQAVAALPRRQRAVVTLRYFLDLSVDETATTLRTSSSAVRSLSHRAVAQLRMTLNEQDVILSEEVRDAH